MAHFGTHPQQSQSQPMPTLDELRNMQDQITAGLVAANKVLEAMKSQAGAWAGISDLTLQGTAPFIIETNENGSLEFHWQAQWAAHCRALAIANVVTAQGGVEGMERELTRLHQQAQAIAQAIEQRSNLVVGVPAGTQVSISNPITGQTAGLDPGFTRRRKPQ